MASRTRILGFLAAAVCMLPAAGCKDKQTEKLLVEAEQTKAELNKAKGDLTRTRREMADLKRELDAAKETRDELHLTVERLLKERSGVAAAAEQTQEAVRTLTAQSTEHAQIVESLQKDIKQLRALIETQQTLIAEQQATIEILRKNPDLPAGTTKSGGSTEGQPLSEPNKVGGP